MNCSYYQKVREEIYKNYNVKKILECTNDEYLETQQDTFILILRKTNKTFTNDKYFLKNNYIMNTEDNIKVMKELTSGSKTLHDLGFNVFNGNLVWNQERDSLTNDMADIRLIYSGDIIDNKLKELKSEEIDNGWKEYERKLNIINIGLQGEIDDKTRKGLLRKHKTLRDKIDKKHFINKNKLQDKKCKGLTLIINRGYGNANYNLTYALIELEEYYLENHILGIKYKNEISKEELIKKYELIIKSLQDKKTMEFIGMCMGNNAMNTTELEYILPIYRC